MTSSTDCKHHWKAEAYSHHSLVQKKAAEELLKRMHFKGTEHLLDVGCGDGKITAKFANDLPEGSILGIDLSQEMINFAKTRFDTSSYKNLQFKKQDAQDLNYKQQFDVVFSSFALQWLPNPDLFFQGASKSLKPSGNLVLTIPLGISQALEEATQLVTSLPEWQHYFLKFLPGWHFTTDLRYAELLAKYCFITVYFSKILQIERFPTRDSFESYVRPWFSYLSRLPAPLQEPFFKQVIDTYLNIEKNDREEGIIFKFLRLDVIAKK